DLDESDFSDQEDAASATKANDAEIDTDSQSFAEVTKGTNGWGRPLTLKSTPERQYVISVTGGGIHPVAQEIARITGATVVDSFKNPVPNEETIAAVIDWDGKGVAEGDGEGGRDGLGGEGERRARAAEDMVGVERALRSGAVGHEHMT